MKTIALGLLALGLLSALPTEASAMVCARGAYHAGCAGPRGAVVGHRGYGGYGYHGAAVVRPGYGRRCYRGIGGALVCR
jgi:hypothetical protein